MTELTKFTDPEPDLTDKEKDLLRDAGASDALMEVCEYNIEDCPRRQDGKTVQSNSALREVKKYLREWESLTEEKLSEFSHLGGHFFSALWDGDLYSAYSRADYNNQTIMTEVFSQRRINRDKPTHAAEVEV